MLPFYHSVKITCTFLISALLTFKLNDSADFTLAWTIWKPIGLFTVSLSLLCLRLSSDFLLCHPIHKEVQNFALALLASSLLYQPTRTSDLRQTCPHHPHRQAFQQICRHSLSKERRKLWGTATTEMPGEIRRWLLGRMPRRWLRWFRLSTRGLIWPHCLPLDDASVSVGVSSSENEELIFHLNDPPDITLFSFQISCSGAKCQE